MPILLSSKVIESIPCSRTVLVPSLYNAEWTKITNQCLSKVFICPFKSENLDSWTNYPEKQHRLVANLHKWLKKSSKKVDALFFVNLFKDFSPSLTIHFPQLKIAGLVHGCASDPLEPGSSQHLIHLEKSIAKISILCISSLHLLNKLKSARYPLKNFRVTGLPIKVHNFSWPPVSKQSNLCIFNHRLVNEKGIYQLESVWRKISSHIPNAKCIVTWPWADPKCIQYVHQIAKTMPSLNIMGSLKHPEYDYTIDKCVVGFSLATYENFGTSFVYGILRNLCYFVPDRLSYQEISPRSLRYKSLDELVQKVIKALSDQEYAHSLHDEGTSLLHNKFGLPSFLRNAGFIDE